MNSINGIDRPNGYSYNSSLKTAQTAEKSAADVDIQDEVQLSGQSAPENDSNKIYKPDTAEINYFKQVTQNNIKTLHKMVQNLLNNQSRVGGGLMNASMMEFSFDFDFSMESILQDGMVKIDQATRDQVAAMIGEDGLLGAGQVSQNILDFAKELSGRDPGKADALRDAFLKGFGEVAQMFGGKDNMPEVSQKTYAAVMAGFEEWEKGGASDE